MIAIFTEHTPFVIAGIVLSGAFIGVNNTLITEIVMGAAPVERPVASAAYSFLRFCGGAVGPYVALKLGENVGPHAPFWFGACAVLVGVVIMTASRKVVAGTHAPAAHSAAEAEAELVGDLV
jgi:MFS family permease